MFFMLAVDKSGCLTKVSHAFPGLGFQRKSPGSHFGSSMKNIGLNGILWRGHF